MLSNMLNDLTEAMKELDGKKLGVWQCYVVLISLCLMTAKAPGPMWGVLHSLFHVASAVGPLSFATLRYSSF